MQTLLIQSLRASGDPAPPLAATQPPLSCCSSCSVTQQWGCKGGDCVVLTYPQQRTWAQWHAHTRLGGAQLWGVCGGTEPPLLPSPVLCVWKEETPAALNWANLLEDAATPAPDGLSSASWAGICE